MIIKAIDPNDEKEYSMNVEWDKPLLEKTESGDEANVPLSPASELKSVNLQVATIVSNLEMN